MKAYAPPASLPRCSSPARLRRRTLAHRDHPGLRNLDRTLAPFGIGNPEPIFLTRDATLAAPVRLIQERHVCLQLIQTSSQDGGTTPAISALGWSRDAQSSWPARCTQLALAQGSTVDVLYRLKPNTGPYANAHFGGLELDLRDMQPAGSASGPESGS
jgi:hypothetical protein